jgi:hypothetical protein
MIRIQRQSFYRDESRKISATYSFLKHIFSPEDKYVKGPSARKIKIRAIFLWSAAPVANTSIQPNFQYKA